MKEKEKERDVGWGLLLLPRSRNVGKSSYLQVGRPCKFGRKGQVLQGAMKLLGKGGILWPGQMSEGRKTWTALKYVFCCLGSESTLTVRGLSYFKFCKHMIFKSIMACAEPENYGLVFSAQFMIGVLFAIGGVFSVPSVIY